MEDRTVPSFLGPASYAVGPTPASVAVGDFNGDGIPDLVTANRDDFGGPSSLSVLLGNGDGTFQDARHTAFGSVPNKVAVGDFDRDGRHDLVVAGTPGVHVLLGNGDGTFQTAVSYVAGRASVAVGDFNGDGILDLASVGDRGASVLLGLGDGSFQPAIHYPVNGSGLSLAVADLNGDGTSDLAVGDAGTAMPPRPSGVSTLLGNGDGTFQDARHFANGSRPTSLEAGDFDRDGQLDLVFMSMSRLTVVRGNGDGTFQGPVTHDAGRHRVAVAVGDFNGDDTPDLVVSGSGYSNVNVLLGNGDGSFGTPVEYPAGFGPSAVAVGDLNSDGLLDLGVANEDSDDVSVLLGNGDGSFQTGLDYTVGANPVAVAAGDFNGDGNPDLVAANAGSGSVSVLLGNGDGSFQDPSSYPVGNWPHSLAIGDFNGDGQPDLVVVNSDPDRTVSVLLGNGDGSFQKALRHPVGPNSTSVAVGDFNHDNQLDLAVTDGGDDEAFTGSVSVFLGNGDGTFQTGLTYSTGTLSYAVAVGDFNRDEWLDLAVVNRGGLRGSVSVLLGNGDGSFQISGNYEVGDIANTVAVGDFNGDGQLDLVVANEGYPSALASSLSVLLGNDDGSFQDARHFSVGADPECVNQGDFNQDGWLDLVVAFRSGAGVFLGNGDGTFRAPTVRYGTGSSIFEVAVGDFNGDRFPDLVMPRTFTSNTITVLINAADWPGPSPARSAGRGDDLAARAAAAAALSSPTGLPTLLTPAAVLPPALAVGQVDGFFAAVGRERGGVGLSRSNSEGRRGPEGGRWRSTVLVGQRHFSNWASSLEASPYLMHAQPYSV